jgi:hypothetical protein
MTDDPFARAARRTFSTGRASARAAFVGGRMGLFDRAALDLALANLLTSLGTPPSVFPNSNTKRWVPIGPSITISPDGETFARSTGRVRDIKVNSDGSRAYAATGKGGVWYTDDGGATWAPVGGWANRVRTAGGLSNAQACSSLLVSFGAATATSNGVDQDFVLVGTGELAGWGRPIRGRARPARLCWRARASTGWPASPVSWRAARRRRSTPWSRPPAPGCTSAPAPRPRPRPAPSSAGPS